MSIMTNKKDIERAIKRANANPNVQFSENDLIDNEEFKPENIKVKISMYLDSDVLKELKKKVPGGKGYTTLINEMLREWLFERPHDHLVTQADLEEALENFGKDILKRFATGETKSRKASSR